MIDKLIDASAIVDKNSVGSALQLAKTLKREDVIERLDNAMHSSYKIVAESDV